MNENLKLMFNYHHLTLNDSDLKYFQNYEVVTELTKLIDKSRSQFSSQDDWIKGIIKSGIFFRLRKSGNVSLLDDNAVKAELRSCFIALIFNFVLIRQTGSFLIAQKLLAKSNSAQFFIGLNALASGSCIYYFYHRIEDLYKKLDLKYSIISHIVDINKLH